MLADVLLLRGRGRRNLLEPAAGGAGSPRLRPGAVEPLPAKDAMPPAAPNGRPARSPPPPFTSAAGAHAAAGPAAPRCAGWPGPRRGDDLLLFPPSPPPPHTLPVCVQPARLAAAAAAPPLFPSLPSPPPPPPPRPARPPQRAEEREGNGEPPPPPPGRTGPSRTASRTLGCGRRHRHLLRPPPRRAAGSAWQVGGGAAGAELRPRRPHARPCSILMEHAGMCMYIHAYASQTVCVGGVSTRMPVPA